MPIATLSLLLLMACSTMGSTQSETLTSIGPKVLSTVALGGGDMYQLPGWDSTPKPTATVVPLASVRATCAGGKHSTYDWALLMPIRRPGVLETYYHYVVEFALPLSIAVLEMAQQHNATRGDARWRGAIVLTVASTPESMSRWPSYASKHSTDAQWVLQHVRSWGWLTELPVRVVVAEALPAPLCAVEVQNGLSLKQVMGCNPLSTPQQRAPREYCLTELRRVGEALVRQLRVAPSPAKPAAPQVLFIPREQFAGAKRTRKIANWAEVLDALTDETMRAGVALQSLVFDGLPLAEQVAALRTADVVITQRGSVNANFVVLRPETRVLLLSDPVDYDPFYWLGPLWFQHTGVHIRGHNFDPFGVVDVPAMRRELRNILTAHKHAAGATGSLATTDSPSPNEVYTAPRHTPPHHIAHRIPPHPTAPHRTTRHPTPKKGHRRPPQATASDRKPRIPRMVFSLRVKCFPCSQPAARGCRRRILCKPYGAARACRCCCRRTPCNRCAASCARMLLPPHFLHWLRLRPCSQHRCCRRTPCTHCVAPLVTSTADAFAAAVLAEVVALPPVLNCKC